MPENHQDDDEQITRLLRLKRFEQPPPEYFDRFLREFQDRQRAQLLRTPAWRIAWERFTAFVGAPMGGHYGYGMASLAVLVAAAFVSAEILKAPPTGEAIAQHQVVVPDAQPASLTLNSNLVPLPDVTELARQTAHSAASMQPRYVMDKPVSYEPPTSF